MEIKKIHLDDIKRCYCASSIKMNGKNHIFLASEDPDVACNMYSGSDFSTKENVWTKPGGCMSIVPIPGRENEILAVQEFYLKVSPSQSKIVWGKYTENGWEFQDVVQKEYIHRFGLLIDNGNTYLVFATIADQKQDKADWSKPGSIYAGKLPENPTDYEPIKIKTGLFRNHGFWQADNACYFGSDQGIDKLTVQDGEYCFEHVLDGTIGEIATADLDGDGENEIMTIEPFHGNAIKIYKKENGNYKEVWAYDNTIDFAHTLVGTTLKGVPTFLAGVRREEAEVFYVQYTDGKYQATIIEKGVGPANLCVVHEEGRDVIVSANHTANEAAVYIVE